MEKYRLMLEYTFFFFVAALSMIVLATNLTYEVVVGRQERRPSFIQKEDKWVVQKTTKGVPPVKIVTLTEWRQVVNGRYQTSYTRHIHWGSIVGVVGFSVFMSGILIFIGAALLTVVSKIPLPQIKVHPPPAKSSGKA